MEPRIVVVVVLVSAVSALLTLGLIALLRRHRARRALEASADQMGIRRLDGETDEELRERCASFLTGPRSASKSTIERDIRLLLWQRGYRRASVVAAPTADPWHVQAIVLSPRVPPHVLDEVSREMDERLPIGLTIAVEPRRRS